MNNPKVNYTQEDSETFLINLFTKMLIEREHPDIHKKMIEQAKQLTKQFLEKNNVDK